MVFENLLKPMFDKNGLFGHSPSITSLSSLKLNFLLCLDIANYATSLKLL